MSTNGSRCCGAPVRRVFRIAPGNDVVECTACGLQYAEVYPAIDAADREIYGAEYFRPEVEKQGYRLRLFGEMMAELEERLGRAPGRLLDVGAGDGAILRAAIERGWTAEGTDISSTMVRHLADELGLTMHLGVVEEIDLPAHAYDAVVMNHVLEHVENPLRTLARVRELLAPGGLVRVEVPNLGSLSSRFKNFQSRWHLKRKPWKHYSTNHHFWFFTPRTLASTAERAGLRVVEVRAPVKQWGDIGWGTRLLNPLVNRARLGGHLAIYATP